MASTFHVYMVGLICHVGEDNDTAGKFKKHAAIVNEPVHHNAPRICIKAGDRYDGGGDVRYALQQNDRIKFSLPGNLATTSALFQDSIPSLSFITDGGQLDNDVKGHKKAANVLGYIDYPNGNLTVAKMYDKTGEYVFLGNALDNPHCIGAIVEFNATTEAPYVTVTVTDDTDFNASHEPEVFKVKADRKICIMNDSHHAEPGQHHLDHHRKLTNAPQIARVVPTNNKCTFAGITPDCACPNPHLPPGVDRNLGDPECSNSQWP